MTSIPSTRGPLSSKAGLPHKNGSPFYLEKPLGQAPRGGSPHSEAVASSEDEKDIVVKKPAGAASIKGAPGLPPLRRGSWLSEVQSGPMAARRASQGGVSITSNNSQPSTPGEHGSWNTLAHKSSAGTVSYSNPWTSDARREPPSRLTELPQSPSNYFHSALGFGDELRSPGHELPSEESLHFRKTMRSQSYSVGQSEDGPVPNAPNRVRASFQALHQPRPGILGDLHEEEVSNNQGAIPVSKAAPGPPSSALLKQALGVRHRASSTSVNAGTWSPQRSQTFSESDYAIDEADDNESESGGHQSVGMLGRGLADRRFSEMSPLRTDFSLSRMNDGSQRFAWNSPGFDPIDEGSQSRRHSFAVVTPHSHTRLNNSFFSTDSNIEDDMSASRISQNSQPDIARNMHSPSSQMRPQNYHQEREYDHFRSNSGDEESAIELGQAHDRAFAQSYFSGVGPAMRSAHTTVPGISATAPSMVNPYAPPNVARPTKHLYIVTFKCSRSDVYYIPENVGLEVKAGDMVIVEGDRGQDLGQVTHCDVTLEDARQNLKEASEQHFRWLMMFSRHVQNGNSGLVNPNGMLAASNGEQYGREGGMGPRPPLQAPIVDDIRPKMLKRLAQGHEIQVLRDKEGAEAKAKRVCQQKAIEHGLTMEILDAEYQLDYKKLTFFYYADCYINFNHLVTDLFKVYKARIWMSAVNPASFATPSNALSQLPPPSSLGPGATSNANGNGFPTTMTIGPSYGRGAFSGISQPSPQNLPLIANANPAPRTPGGLEVNSTDAQQDYQESQGRPVYHYAPSPAFGGFNPVAPAYAPTWVQNPPMNRYMPYQYGYGGGPGGGYPGNYSPFPGQEVGGSRAGEHSQNDEQDINRVLAQSLSLNQRAGS